MSNTELLHKVHSYIHEVNFFHSRIVDTCDRKKLDAIFQLRVRMAFISRLKPERYAVQILIIAKDLSYVLPNSNYPAYYVQREKLLTIINSCKENIKAQKLELA